MNISKVRKKGQVSMKFLTRVSLEKVKYTNYGLAPIQAMAMHGLYWYDEFYDIILLHY